MTRARAESEKGWLCPRCGQLFHRTCTLPTNDPLREPVPASRRPPTEPPPAKERAARFDAFMDEARAHYNRPLTAVEETARGVSRRSRRVNLAMPQRLNARLGDLLGETA